MAASDLPCIFLPSKPSFTKIMEQLLQGNWGGVIGDMIAVFFVLCHFFGKMQHGQHCATKSTSRISKIRTNTRPLSPCSGRSTGSDKPKNSGFQWCPPELQQGEGRGHLQPQGSHLEQIFIKSGGNKKL